MRKSSWPRDDEEESISGEKITAGTKYPEDGKELRRSRGKKCGEGIVARQQGCLMNLVKDIFYTLRIMKGY